MRRRRLWLGLAAAFLLVGGIATAALLVPWSRSCDAEKDRAEAAFRAYAAGESAERQAAASEVARAIPGDVSSAMELADRLGPPLGASEAYREAMETLSLAESACREAD